MPSEPASSLSGLGLADLEARVREDLSFLNYPPPNWMPEQSGPNGRPATDVVVIGAGMCGLVAAFALLQAGIRNIRVLDRRSEGSEGPWTSYARMETLRSPKQLLGPAYGMASLTFQAWFRAQFGDSAWEELFRIPRPMWMDYLHWYRRVLELPVENGVEVRTICPAANGLFALDVAGAMEPVVHARKVVMATGREGLGAPAIPAFVETLPREYWAHSSDTIDFGALRGKRVVVIGVGASAVDNAAEALEASAADVRLLARRTKMPTVNKMMGIGSYGLVAGWPAMPPEWRWRFLDYSYRTQTPAPRNSTQRVSRHANAHFHFDTAVKFMHLQNGEVLIGTERGRTFLTDFVILGTGFTVDTLARPEIAGFASEIASWSDRYTAPPGETSPGLSAYPWLRDDFSFTEKCAGDAPFLRNLHCFNYGATLSLGKVSGDIPAISEGAAWLARGIAAAFFNADVEHHWAAIQAYSKPELLGDEWVDADAASGPEARAI
jgi:cation diffusion facilitator CzcD-associated flavoprotein CzcO